jgi:type I restriction enzyme S subunit
MNEQKKLVPKQRFPEFKESGDWQLVPMNRLATRTKQKNRDEKIVRVLTNSAEFGVMDQRDFFDKDIATQGNLDTYYVVELGSYVYNPRISATAPVGPISKNKIGTGVMSPLYTVFKFKDESNDFYEHYFKTTGWHGYLRQTSSTGARHDRMAISSDDFMAMPLLVSTPKEQQKIADCLSSLEELIVAQARKVEAIKTHKKGLMQQLFPREGETQPRLQFPEFQGKAAWMIWPGDKLFEQISDKNPTPGLPVLAITQEHGAIPRSMIDYHVSVTDKSIESYKVVQVGDFIISLRSFQGGIEYSQYLGICSPAYVVLRRRVEGSDTYFKHYLKTDRFIQILTKNLEGLRDGKMISYKQFCELQIPIASPNEQKKIAECLSSLDNLVTTATQELEFLKIHKSGLMQLLFPSLEVLKA